MAIDWGTLLTATGKAVWCELSAALDVHCRKVRRAEAAALAEYRRDAGTHPQLQSRAGHILEESATDLIADLLHWVAAKGGDPDVLLDRAQMHFEAESGMEGVAEAACGLSALNHSEVRIAAVSMKVTSLCRPALFSAAVMFKTACLSARSAALISMASAASCRSAARQEPTACTMAVAE
ncbi:hypothetical protein ACIBKZ_06400 [Streptomyces sp. NPDC050421]|uniref:hypothetical protein n=1 Tax=Streptomyces sp. NPDC050421 TaxID=3365613 RepID=UPI0037B1166B